MVLFSLILLFLLFCLSFVFSSVLSLAGSIVKQVMKKQSS